jgi:DmsE family decaheme c-type cytochrome
LHSSTGDPRQVWSFTRLESDQQVAVCSRCHDDPTYAQFPSTAHAAHGTSCATCHPAHPENLAAPGTGQPGLCYRCHADVRTRASLPSHHPIREGRMQCSDCHDLHGADADLAIAGRTNDLCTRCHREKEGPFAFEHAPVVEDCATCHEAHGTVVNNLLKRTEPYLCLGCHHVHFQITEHRDVRATASARCTQCHTAIHGSDLPSLVKSGAGRALIP